MMTIRLAALVLVAATPGCLDTADLGGGPATDGNGGEGSGSGAPVESSSSTGVVGSEASTAGESSGPEAGSTTTSGGESSGSTIGEPPPEGGLGPWGFGYAELDAVARSVALEDFNGDGNLDIVAQRRQNATWWLQTWAGDGQGGFTSIGETSVTGWDDLLRAGDFDGDGAMDVAAFRESYDDHFAIAYGDGSGSFSESERIDIGGFFGFGVRPMRYDDDGATDLFIPQGHSEQSLVARATPGSGFEIAAMVDTFGCYFSGTGAGDVDGDGLDEVVATGSCNSTPTYLPFSVYRHGPGGFELTQTFTADLGPVSEGGDVVVVDADDDGDLDAVTPTANGLYVVPGDGAGGFEDPLMWPHTFAGDRAWPTSVRRIVPVTRNEDDAVMFVLATREATGPAAIVEPAGVGTLETSELNLQGRVTDSGDFDNDGRPDVVVLLGEEGANGNLQGPVAIWLSGP